MKTSFIPLITAGVLLASGPVLADNSNSKSSSAGKKNSYYSKPKYNRHKKTTPFGSQGKYGPYGKKSKLPYKQTTYPGNRYGDPKKNRRYDHMTNSRARGVARSSKSLRVRQDLKGRLKARKQLKRRWTVGKFIKLLKRKLAVMKLALFKDARARMENRDVAASRQTPFSTTGGFGHKVHRSSKLVRDRWQHKRGRLPKKNPPVRMRSTRRGRPF